jgi:hypothetical protein
MPSLLFSLVDGEAFWAPVLRTCLTFVIKREKSLFEDFVIAAAFEMYQIGFDVQCEKFLEQ